MTKRTLLLLMLLWMGFATHMASASGNGTDNKSEVIHLTKADFLKKVMDYEKNPNEWKYLGSLPCIIDFYADWCGPCRKASPILEELAQKYKGKIVVYKIDTEKERELSSVFGIRGIPAFLWVPKSGKPTMSSGIAQTDDETRKMFEKMINDILIK